MSQPTEPVQPPIPATRRQLAPAAFSVSARVAMQLGRESIASTNTAILELVKNAYDADATLVRIRFCKLGTPEAFLIIEDNGSGMTEDEIREHWLCIGTANKQALGLSRKNGRVQTGEKGLGRLGLDRLSRRTLLQTKRRALDDDPTQLQLLLSASDSKALELDIDWERYNAARGQRLETIAHEVYELEHLNIDPATGEHVSFEHGTRLILEGLKDHWTEHRIRELQHELALTLSPFSDQSDFKISIETDKDELNGVVHPSKELLHLATWQVEAAIEKAQNGSNEELVWVKMNSPAHERAYSFGPVSWHEFTKHSNNAVVSKCGPVTLKLHIFIRDKGEMGVEFSGIGSFLEANRGIRIYRDGFRIKPYGDPKGANDWLSLSLKRAQNPAAISRKSWKVAYHQVVGAVLISRQRNEGLADQTNREGIVDGPAMNDLKMFAQKVIGFFEGKAHEDYVAQNPPQPKPKPEAKEATKSFVDVEDTLQAVARKAADLASSSSSASSSSFSSDKTVIQDLVAGIQQALDESRTAKEVAAATEKAQAEEIDELKDELRLTTSLASLGIMAASFGHERVKDAASIRNNIGILKRLYEHPGDGLFSEQDRGHALRFLEEGALRIEAFAQFALDHVRPGKRRGSESDLFDVVSTTCRMFKSTTDTMKVKVTQNLPSHSVTVPGWQAGWESVIANLLINSLYFLRGRKADDRIIHIELTETADNCACLLFEDNGKGLEAGTETDIFRPGFSTRRGEDGQQEGTGLGLTLVKSFIAANRGSITAKKSPTLDGAAFEITVPSLPTSKDHA